MGLDNGIDIRRNEKSMNVYDKIKCFEEDWAKQYGYNFNVCYWRKCHNIRTRIIMALGGIADNGKIVLEREQISKIIAVLKSLNKNNWDEYGGSIWEWKEFKNQINRDIKNLKYLYRLMGKCDLDVYFYDSY